MTFYRGEGSEVGKRQGFYTTPFTSIHCDKKKGAKKEMENQRQKRMLMKN